MKSIACIAAFIFSSLPGVCQKYVDIAKLHYANTALNSFEGSSSTTRVEELGLDLTVPIVINSSHAALTGMIYERIQTKLFESEGEETISVFGLRAGLSIKHSDKWSGSYILIPKLASDFESITGDDFQLGAIALLKYTKRENLNYKMGLYYNSELFGPFIVPILGLYHLSKDGKFETNLTLPFQADFNYKLSSLLHIGMNFSGLVRSYHLSSIPSSNGDGYVVKASNELGGYLRFNLARGLSIQTRVGYSIGRSYRVYDADDKIAFGSMLLKIGDNRQQLNTDFSDGFVYQAMLTYRFIQE